MDSIHHPISKETLSQTEIWRQARHWRNKYKNQVEKLNNGYSSSLQAAIKHRTAVGSRGQWAIYNILRVSVEWKRMQSEPFREKHHFESSASSKATSSMALSVFTLGHVRAASHWEGLSSLAEEHEAREGLRHFSSSSKSRSQLWTFCFGVWDQWGKDGMSILKVLTHTWDIPICSLNSMTVDTLVVLPGHF